MPDLLAEITAALRDASREGGPQLDLQWRLGRAIAAYRDAVPAGAGRDEGPVVALLAGRFGPSFGPAGLDRIEKFYRDFSDGSALTARSEVERGRRFLELTDSFPLVVWTCDAEGACDYLGPQWLAYTGVSPDEDLGHGWKRRVHPDDGAMVARVWAEAIEKRAALVAELRMRRYDGEYRWFQTRATPAVDPRDGSLRWYGASVDITDRRRDEELTRREEERFRTLADTIPQIVWVAARDGAFEYFNARTLEYTGRAHDELVGWGWAVLIHPDDIEHTTAVWREVIETGRTEEIEFRLRRADGEYRWHIGRQVLTRDEGGAGPKFYGTRTDVHEKRVALALAAEKSRLLDSVRDSVIVTDLDGVVTHWNEGATRLFGWAPEERIGRPYGDVFDEPQRSERTEAIKARATGDEFHGEYEDLRKDGSRVWIHARVGPLFDAAGRARGILGVSYDISKRKRDDEALRKSEERFRLLVEQSPDAITLHDGAGAVVDANRRACESHGYARDELLGMKGEALAPYLPLALEKLRASRLEPGQVVTYEGTNVRRDGSEFPVEVRLGHLEIDGGAHVVVITRDVSERKQAEAELRLRERALREVSQGILIADATRDDMPIAYASPGFEALTGYTRAEVTGRNCRFLQGPQTDPASVALLRESIRAGRSCSVELLNYKKDGTPFWCALSLAPLREQGKLTHFVGVQTDVTARRNLELRYLQAQKMEVVGQLAGGVAHDFNNLLCVINSEGEALSATLRENDECQDSIAAILEASQRATALTSQLLAFSRKSIVEPKVLDLNELVDQLGKMLRRLVGEDVALATRLAPALRPVKVDAGQIEQLIVNLVVNARDAMPTGGTLTIETCDVRLGPDEGGEEPGAVAGEAYPPAGEYVALSIRDTGTGIDAATQGKIFEPFFTTKEVGKGTGLGLATVYGIARSYGGHVRVASAPGEGATFTVLLPAVLAPARRSGAVRGVEHAARGSETVLLAEDEPAVRRVARVGLEAHGYRVLEASSGEDALRVEREHAGPVHLLLTDVVMPGMGGRVLAEQLRAKRPSLRVLYMSGYTDDAVVRHGVYEATDAFLQKPFTQTSLARKVRAVLDGE